MQPGADRSNRTLKHRRYLRVIELMQLAENHDFAIRLRQTQNCLPD